jgi:RNA polymerase sigma-70 factor, ECF subfamily
MNVADHSTFSNFQEMEPVVVQDKVADSATKRSPGTFTELHSVYSRRLYKTILKITRNPEDAEDALQDAFLQAHLALHTFEGRASVYSWLTRIAINSALTILRKRRTRPEILFDPQRDFDAGAHYVEPRNPAPNPEELCDLGQRHLTAVRAIHRLDPHLREPIWMQTMHGWSLREIAQALNISVTAVKARLHRARLQLSATQIDSKYPGNQPPTGPCASTTMLRRRSIRRIAWCPPTPSPRSPRSRTITTAQPLIPATSRNGSWSSTVSPPA